MTPTGAKSEMSLSGEIDAWLSWGNRNGGLGCEDSSRDILSPPTGGGTGARFRPAPLDNGRKKPALSTKFADKEGYAARASDVAWWNDQ